MEQSSTRPASARVVAVLCAALCLGSTASITGPQPANAGGGPGTKGSDVAAAASFRDKLGLRADRSFVASTFGKAGFSSARWGIPLDPSESAEVSRRAALQTEAASAIRDWGEDAESAGAYLDQHARGAPVFLTTGDPARAKGRLAKLMPPGANARFLRVRYSMAQLLAVQDRVNADFSRGGLAGLGVQSTSIDARANAVVIGVSADTEAVRAALAGRYGDAVRSQAELPAQGGDAGGCTARSSCPPAKAGIEIVSSYNGNNCTIGFLVHVEGSPDPRILTAGHCISKSGGTGTSRSWSHDGSNIGWAELGYWTDGADADVGLIDPTGGAISGDRNLLYGSSASNLVSITSYRATSAQVQGSLVCRSAVVSGYHCGTIELTNRTKDVDGHTIDHQWVVDFDACPGDSGGPYFLGAVAYGIHTDSTVGCDPATNQAWYSPMGWVLSVLAARGHPVSLCVTASCGAQTNTWTASGPIDQASWGAHLVPLADGRVLQVGGESGTLLVAGGGGGGRVPEVFDPSTGLWSDTATPPWAPADCDGQFAVRLGDGRVLVGGGRHSGSGSADACDGAQLFDPTDGANGSWTPVAAPPTALESAGAVLLKDGRAFVTGGSGAAGSTSVAMAYSPSADSWTTLASAPSGALDPLVLRLGDGRVLVSGGYLIADADAPGYTDTTATRLYNPSSNTWSTTTAVGARGVAGVVLKDGRVVVAGGQHLTWNGAQGSSFLTAVTRFDPATGAWTSLKPMGTGRAVFTLAEMPNGMVLAAGGRVAGSTPAGQTTKTVEGWDPASKAWYVAPDMQVARGDQDGAVLGDGSLLVAGGGTSSSETYIAGDIVPPTAAAPATSLRSIAEMTTSSVPVQLSWSAASDTGGSGLGTYDVARSIDGGSFSTIATRLTATAYNTTTSRTHTYRYEVRARDWAGNVGPWKAGTSFRMNVAQETWSSVSFSGGWRTATSSSYSGGSLRYATTSGPSATYSFTGRAVGFVSSRGPNRGSFKVYLDGSYVTTVGLYASAAHFGSVVFHKTWSSSGRHTIRIVAVANSGHPRVDVDAFEVISAP